MMQNPSFFPSKSLFAPSDEEEVSECYLIVITFFFADPDAACKLRRGISLVIVDVVS